MSDARIPLEQGPTIEQQPRPVIAPEAPLPEPVIQQRSQVNVENFYKDEVARHKIEQTLPGTKAWEVIEKAAESREPSGSREEERQPRPRSIMDKVHRQTLLMQARLEGVKDLGRFQELADYFESTVSEHESKHVNVPKGLSDEQKKKVVADWKAKGWDGAVYSIHEYDGDKNASLSLSRNVPLRLERHHVKLMKQLVSGENNPVELAEGLRKMGFWFSEYRLKSPDEMRKLGELFTAPHVKEALELAYGVSNWGSDWFANEGGYSSRPVEVGQIEFLTQLAQSPDPKAAFPPELVQKIDTLSRALNINVGVAEIGQLQTLMNNPDYLDFAAYLTKLGSSSHRQRVLFFENITALDQAGILKPVVELYRAGVSVETSDIYHSSSSAPSLGKLFDSYESEYKPQEVQQEVVQYMQGVLAQPEVQAFLEDTQRREFVGVLADLRGYPVNLGEISNLDELFGEGLARGKDAICVLKFMQGIRGESHYSPDMSTLGEVTSNPRLMETFRDPNFSTFLQTLQERTGYTPNSYDLFYSGKLANVFNNPDAREGLVRESTAEVIKALHPGGGLDLYQPEFYIRLGNNPNMVPTINALRGIGYNMSDYHSLSDANTLEAIANDPEAVSKLESPELKSLTARLTQEFKWEIKSYEVTTLLVLHDDKELQSQLFTPENLEFVKKIRASGISLSEIKPMLETDPAHRELMVQMVTQFGYYPKFNSWKSRSQSEMFDKLLQRDELRTKLFSERTQDVVKRLQKDFGYYCLEIEDIETIVNAPTDFPDFIGELKDKYKYNFQRKDLIPLLQLSANKEGFNGLLDTLVNHGYSFRTEDIASISQLLPHVERLPALLSTVNQVLSREEVQLGEAKVTEQYVFNVQDIPSLLQLEPFADRLPSTVETLSEVMGYRFNVRDSQQLAFVIEGGYTKDRLVGLKQIYDKYKDQYSGEFNIGAIQTASFVEGNEEVIARLESYNYKFNLQHVQHLRGLLESPDKETIFQALDILRDNLPFSYNPNLSRQYVKLANIPGIEDKLREAGTKVAKEDLLQENNFKLFVALSGNADLYVHARKLLSDDYFRNIRDAQNRFSQFNSRMLSGEIPDEVLAKIFSVSGKATELDRIALKYGINAEIAKAARNENWQDPLLHATNFQEANEAMTRMMTDLAIPVIYSGMQGEELSAKQNELIELAGKEKDFDDILEINCRAVGVYGQKYPSKGQEFDVLMGAIRQSLELNMERNPKAYLEKRAELSEHQFDRVFEGIPQDVRDRVMKTWLDLAPRRRLRVSGDVVTAEEATLSRLNRIRDIVHTDLSVHLQELFTTKVRDLEAAGETNGPGAEQLAIYKQYLLTPEGVVRQDIPMMYRSVETFIRDAQAKLKNPETPKEEKGKLGKSLGTYQGISDSLKAIYRLGTISEERYKARRDYLNEIDKHIGEFSGALKRLKLLDPDKRSADVNTRALEEEVLLDFGKLKGTMAEENVSGQTVFETESTVAFRNLARAPEITQSCQRLTEVTGYNHAAYSRLLDGSNEMIDIYEMRNGERNRLARSFVELSRVRLTGEEQSRLVVLIDREYVNPQYQNFGNQFSSEMMLHMLDRLSAAPELSLIFDSNSNRFTANPDVQEVLQARGYQLRQVSGEYFINESNVKLAKYYDSLGGVNNVTQPSWRSFGGFYIIEKIT